MHMQFCSLNVQVVFTTSSIELQGVSLSNASCMDMQDVSISSGSCMHVEVLPLCATSSMDVQAEFLFSTTSSTVGTCSLYSSPSLAMWPGTAGFILVNYLLNAGLSDIRSVRHRNKQKC